MLRDFNDMPGLFGKWHVSATYTGDKIQKETWKGSGKGGREIDKSKVLGYKTWII